MTKTNNIPLHERTFPLRLAPAYTDHFSFYLYWLRQMMERLGREATQRVWELASGDGADELLEDILSSGWEPVAKDEEMDVEGEIAEILAEVMPSPVAGLSADEAREIIEGALPFRQIRDRLPALNVVRQTSTYDALHLLRDGAARLAEALIERHGKEGELIAYDAMLDELRSVMPQMSVADFMSGRISRFTGEPKEADIFSAGLEVELVRGSEQEVVTVVKACEWARYYRERHPRVGYLLACSTDNPAYRAINKDIRLQRTASIMEGGQVCDFRVYALE